MLSHPPATAVLPSSHPWTAGTRSAPPSSPPLGFTPPPQTSHLSELTFFIDYYLSTILYFSILIKIITSFSSIFYKNCLIKLVKINLSTFSPSFINSALALLPLIESRIASVAPCSFQQTLVLLHSVHCCLRTLRFILGTKSAQRCTGA